MGEFNVTMGSKRKETWKTQIGITEESERTTQGKKNYITEGNGRIF